MSKLIEKEGRFYKECGVVMLETTQESHDKYLVINKKGQLRIWDTNKFGSQRTLPVQHLYITSDDEIKEGDWIYHPLDIKPIQFYSTVDLLDPLTYGYKKIIATTDSSLTLKSKCTCTESEAIYCGEPKSVGKCQQLLPQPSDKFIQAYIEAYNKGEKIEKVLVEYEEKCVGCGAFPASGITHCTYPIPDKHKRTLNWFLKLKDNNIIIKKVKDSWSREEVASLIRKTYDEFMPFQHKGDDVDKWIEENL